MTFHAAQQQAITHVDGPMLTLAGPGSGKTTVITERIRYLIQEQGISPKHILVITFTKAAAKEMQTRFELKMQGANAPCTFGTFHSVFFSFLRVAYGFGGQNILTEDMKYQLIRELVRELQLEYEDEEDFIEDIVNEISQVKSEMYDLESYYSKNMGEDVFRHLYRIYEKRRNAMNKLDFDDILVYCHELLKERPDILENLRKRYQYILIDEFQDINPIQYAIVKLLAAPKNNLFIVGDDDQSVYRFRGARPEIMLGFMKEYPDAKQVLLNVNYRCSRDICESAGKVIAHNETRFPKAIVSSGDYDIPVHIYRMKTRRDENLHILKLIHEYHKQGIPYEAMAILYRTNIQPRALAGTLMEFNMPFRMRDKIPSLYQHFVVKHIMSYIKIALGDHSRQLYLQIINKPTRYISRDAFSKEWVNLDEVMDFYEDKRWAVENLIQLSNDLHVLKKMSPFSAINYIRKAIGYDDYLEEYASIRHMKVEELYQVLEELAEQAKAYTTYDAWFAGIAEYEDALKQQMQEIEKRREGVFLSTMHNAKGLEFDVVFVIEANEGMMPHKKSTQPEELEEERRMFYVAMTRARRHLNICTVSELFGKPVEPSRFLEEMK